MGLREVEAILWPPGDHRAGRIQARFSSSRLSSVRRKTLTPTRCPLLVTEQKSPEEGREVLLSGLHVCVINLGPKVHTPMQMTSITIALHHRDGLCLLSAYCMPRVALSTVCTPILSYCGNMYMT